MTARANSIRFRHNQRGALEGAFRLLRAPILAKSCLAFARGPPRVCRNILVIPSSLFNREFSCVPCTSL